MCGPEAGGARGPPREDSADRAVTGPPEGRAPAGPRALQRGLSAGLTRRVYLRAAAAASPSHGLCRPPLSGSSRLRRRGLPSEAGARPRAARTHTPTPRAPPPPACRSASRAQRGPHWARAPRSRRPPRSPLPRLPGAGRREGVRAPAPARTTRVPPRRGGRARERGGHPTLGTRPQRASTAWAPGWASAAGLGAGRTRSARPPLSLSPPCHLPSGGQVCEARWGRTPGASSLARAAGACGKRGGAARAGRPGVGPAGREAAPFVRVSEPCLRAVPLPRRPRRRAGCAHLGRRRPPPRRRGGISLKAAGASLFRDRGRRESGAPSPARGGSDGSCHPRGACLTAAPAGSWRVQTQRARGGGGGAGPGGERTRRRPRAGGQPSRWASDSRRSALSARSPGQRWAVSSSGTGTVRHSVSYPAE